MDQMAGCCSMTGKLNAVAPQPQYVIDPIGNLGSPVCLGEKHEDRASALTDSIMAQALANWRLKGGVSKVK